MRLSIVPYDHKNVSRQMYKIGVIGLGYVGLPLARLFSTKYETIGFDINTDRVAELTQGYDSTQEVEAELLQDAIGNGLVLTSDKRLIGDCDIYVVTVPTPVDRDHVPDLSPLKQASQTVGEVLSEGNIVIYESTVFPGATEDICIPIVEEVSGLKYKVQFFAGYSPERVSPGDKTRSIEHVVKITSGSSPEVAQVIDRLYSSVIVAGTHLAPSIRVAEAAKVIENAQRDMNIAFINELARVFAPMGIDTHDVLAAASTKWNFVRVKPGLVGGHCIGVDPYYLIDRSKTNGYSPSLLLAARLMNDEMPGFVVDQITKLMRQKGLSITGARVLVLGYTFKENCPDTRNTKVEDLIQCLEAETRRIDVFDPWVKTAPNGRRLITGLSDKAKYDCIVLAVAHTAFGGIDYRKYIDGEGVIYDIKSFLPREMVDGRL